MAQEVWEVYRRMIVMVPGDPWERLPYESRVWKCDNGTITATPQIPHMGYAAGLFIVKLNGVSVPLNDFKAKLATLGLTIKDVEKACA